MTNDGISAEIFLVSNSLIVTKTTTAKAARNHDSTRRSPAAPRTNPDEADKDGRDPNPIDLLAQQSSSGEGDRKRDEPQHCGHVGKGEIAQREQEETGADGFDSDAGANATVTQHPESVMVTPCSRHEGEERDEDQATNEDRLEQVEVLNRLLHEGVVHDVAEHAERHPRCAPKVLLATHLGSLTMCARGR